MLPRVAANSPRTRCLGTLSLRQTRARALVIARTRPVRAGSRASFARLPRDGCAPIQRGRWAQGWLDPRRTAQKYHQRGWDSKLGTVLAITLRGTRPRTPTTRNLARNGSGRFL